MAMLILQSIGYGILLFFVLGVAIKIFNVIAPILRLIFFIGFTVLSVATYPLVFIVRAVGYKECPSLFPMWHVYFGTRPPQEHERPQQKETNRQQSSKIKEKLREAEPPFDPWAILEVPRNASKQEIKTAYKNKLVLNHPDKVASLDPALQTFATQRTVLLQKAYEQLVDAA